VSLHDHVHGRQNASRGLLWGGQNRLGVCHATCFMDDEVGDATYGQVTVMGQPEFIMHRQWCIGGYTRVYAVYQPPGFFDSVYSPQ